MIRDYEVMTITKEDLSKSISDLVTSVGGEIIKADVWGKRRFAYEIKHESEGYYDVIQFKLDSDKIDDLKRKLDELQSQLSELSKKP